MKFLNKNKYKISILVVIFVSVISWYISFKTGSIMIYNDSMSHIDIARSVLDNIQPGLAQLGGSWLPLNHLLDIFLVWNNTLWHTGFAGSFWGMVSYILSTIAIFLIVKELTENDIPSFISALIFAFCINLLYLQSTPLTEPIYLVTFIFSVLFFIRYIKKQELKDLILLGFFGLLQVLIRYDGYFVTFFEMIFVVYNQYFISKKSFKKSLGDGFVMYLPIITGVFLWVLWNFLLFSNPVHFLFGKGSAYSQQSKISHNTELVTKHNLILSVETYLYDIFDTNGLYLFILSILGSIAFFVNNKIKVKLSQKTLIFLLLFSPIFFNILALFLGFSIISVPNLPSITPLNISSYWFNDRYGVLALPFIAVLIGFLLSFNIKKYLNYIILILISTILIYQNITFINNGIITITDGTIGTSSFLNKDVAQTLRDHVKSNQKVLASMSYFNPVAFSSGLNLSNFVQEGDRYVWGKALINPQKYVQWILMYRGNVGDGVYTSMVLQHNFNFYYYYKLYYSGTYANIYELKNTKNLYVYKVKNSLKIGSKKFNVHSMDVYNLAYMNDKGILKEFNLFKKDHINTVKFVMFGNGIKSGFQPKSGIINSNRFKKSDYIIYLGYKYNIKLIPILLENQSNYGGIRQYLNWFGLNTKNTIEFYKNKKVITLYKNYINKVLIHEDTYTHKEYKNSSSILSWEIMNTINIKSINGISIVESWENNISSYIEKIDTQHLVNIGNYFINISNGGSIYYCDNKSFSLCSYNNS